MKKKIILILSISIITAISIFIGSTYALFSKTQAALNKDNYQTGILQIGYSSDSNLTVSPVPVTESDVLDNTTPYTFTITNTGRLDYQYDLKILTDATYVAEHGCTGNQIPARYIRVKINDNESALLSSFANGAVLTDEKLSAGQSKTYNLWVWLDMSSPNSIIGKHFHAQIVTEGEAVYTPQTTTLDIASGNIIIANGSTADTYSITVGSNEAVEVTNDFPIILTGTATSNAIKILANDIELTMKDLNITSASASGYYGAIHNEGTNTTINIEGTSTIKGASGIYNAPNSTLTLQGTGTLNATGTDGAGIGGYIHKGTSDEGIGGNIIINSGTIVATGGQRAFEIEKISFYAGAAGIGTAGTYASSGTTFQRTNKTININGGNVTATGKECAAGIGGGAALFYNYGGKYPPVIAGGTINVSPTATVNATAGACEWEDLVNSAGIYIEGLSEPSTIGDGGSISYSK